MAESNPLPVNMDLDAILRTLASLPKPEEHVQHQQDLHQPPDPSLLYQPPHPHLPYQPPHPHLPYQPPHPRLPGRSPHPPSAPTPQARASTPLVDPATIIDWKQGLRCVSKIAAQNPHLSVSVRKLIKDQEGNVRQWDAGRQRLVDEQALKRENERVNRAALSLPGLLENTPILCTPEREQEELLQYHAKVYRASKAMVDSQSSSLKVLGVPFFGVRPHLLASDGDEIPTDADGISTKVTQAQVLELQRKMLTHLLDLYGD